MRFRARLTLDPFRCTQPDETVALIVRQLDHLTPDPNNEFTGGRVVEHLIEQDAHLHRQADTPVSLYTLLGWATVGTKIRAAMIVFASRVGSSTTRTYMPDVV